MKWDDIAKRLPGRSSISCRLRYQNYLEKRAIWDEEKKNKLARLYARYVHCVTPGFWSLVPPSVVCIALLCFAPKCRSIETHFVSCILNHLLTMPQLQGPDVAEGGH